MTDTLNDLRQRYDADGHAVDDNHEDCDKRIGDLEAQLDDARCELGMTCDDDRPVGAACNEQRHELLEARRELAEEKLEREEADTRANGTIIQLAKERARLTAAIDELEWQVENVGDGALHRHEVRTRLYAAIDAAKGDL